MAAERRASESRTFRAEAVDQALGAVLGANPFVRLDPTDLLTTAARVGAAAARPALLGRQLGKFGQELLEVAMGRSERQPERGDRRFADPTWSENAGYRRLMQAYLAACAGVQHLLDEVPVDERERTRARFVASLATEALAPTNRLFGNPAALKRALETGGASVTPGLRHFVADPRHNRGLPPPGGAPPFLLG